MKPRSSIVQVEMLRDRKGCAETTSVEAAWVGPHAVPLTLWFGARFLLKQAKRSSYR